MYFDTYSDTLTGRQLVVVGGGGTEGEAFSSIFF